MSRRDTRRARGRFREARATPSLPFALLFLCALATRSEGLPDGPRALEDPRGALLRIEPGSITLRGKDAREQLLATAVRDGRLVDVTRRIRWRSEPPGRVEVDGRGVARPAGDAGDRFPASVRLTGTLDGASAEVRVRIEDPGRSLPVDFETHIQPILTREGCNSGACHGKARGQNGFQLSLFGFDSDFDYAAIVRESRGRRIFAAVPERSLLLLKPTATVPHGGGLRIEKGSPAYEALERWIARGVPRRPAGAPVLESVEVTPAERLLEPKGTQQLRVTARYSDGSLRDVTGLSTYLSNEGPIAAVDEHGLVRAGPLPGEAAIMARFGGKIAVARILIPQPEPVGPEIYARLPRSNFIDEHVWRKLAQLNIRPSPPADDATFLRRAYLDIIGRLPAPGETREFLGDPGKDKRERLVDRLLERPEYADYWANKWVDLLRPNPYRVGIKATFNLDGWIRERFRENVPWDEFVREIVTAQGSTFRHGPATIFRDRRSPDEIATMMSQLFLGVRLECAKCHQHPFERWRQRDFYAFAAYFSSIDRKGRGLSPPISGSEEMIFRGKKGGTLPHPRTGETLRPAPLFGDAPALEGRDPRAALAEWMVSAENPYFARVTVNRLWAALMGRGLVEPVDDLRDTNPPTNEPLLEALAAAFRAGGYDLKALLRLIATSRVYGLSSVPNETNVHDTRNHSRHYRKRLRAEVLLDAVTDITGVPDDFAALPVRSRAVEVWTHRIPSLFLDTFGRPDPNQDPPCERTSDTTVVQALHLMNSPAVHGKIAAEDGRAARLAASSLSPEEIVEEAYLLMYCRFPTPEELRDAAAWFHRQDRTRRKATEDLFWALLNTPEFVFQD